jgi:hypothetical protein
MLLIALIATISAKAADSTFTREALRKGSWSLQFAAENTLDGAGGFFRLSSYEGGTLSAKRNFSPRSALRFGVTLLARDNKQDEVYRHFITYRKSATVSLTATYLFYPAPHKRVSAFIGGGPTLGFAWADDAANSPTASNKLESRSSTIGTVLLFGAEWFLSRQISLLAEYGLKIAYSTGETVQTRRTGVPSEELTQKIEAKELNVGAREIRIGISVYL